MQYDMIFAKRGKETKEIIDRIKLIAHQIEKRIYTSSDSLNVDYERALHSFKKLYYSFKPFQKVVSLDQVDLRIKEFVLQEDFERVRLKEFIQSQTIEEKKEQIRIISSLLETRYLPTKRNEFGYNIAILLAIGIYSNIFFVFLSDESFSKKTVKDIIFWFSMYAMTAYGLNFLSSKSISDHIRDIKRRMGPNMRNKCALVFRRLKLKK